MMNGLDWNERDELDDDWEFLLGCLQENANAGMGPAGASSTAGDTVDSSTAIITTGPAIVQGVK